MSKWIIVSDNHTEAGILYQIIAWHQDYDVALHLGDSEFEYYDTELSLFQRVKGNCDFYPEFPNEELISSDDIKAFYTHGHLYSVNRGRQQLAERAAQEGCQFAFYGHTHVAKYEQIGSVHVINPGSISQSRSQKEETFAELLIDDNKRRAVLHFRNRNNEILDTIHIKI